MQKKQMDYFGFFFEQFWEPFWGSFWDQIGQREGKMSPRGPSRASKTKKATFSKKWFSWGTVCIFSLLRPPKELLNHKKKGSKKWPKNGPQNHPKITKKVQILGSKMGSMLNKNRSDRSDLGHVSSWTGQLEIQVPRWPQRRPKIASNSLR